MFECNKKSKYTNEILNWKFARTDYSEWSEVKVQAKRPDSKRASTMGTYRFPRAEPTYSSPYLSWENLLYCGGYSVDGNPYLQNVVQQEKKPYAGFGYFTHQYGTPKEQIEAELTQVKNTLPDYCIIGQELFRRTDIANYYICRRGKISDYIDIDKVLTEYQNLHFPVYKGEKKIRKYANIEMKEFSNPQSVSLDYANPRETEHYVITGLLLGYPIESTISVIMGLVF